MHSDLSRRVIAAGLLALTLVASAAAQELLRYARAPVADGSPQPIQVDLELLASDPEVLSLVLPDGQRVRLRRDDSEPRSGSELAWWGSSPDPLITASATLTLHRDRMVGLVHTAGGSFDISTDAAGTQTIVRRAGDGSGWCAGGVRHPRPLTPSPVRERSPASSAGGGEPLRILALYTAAASKERGGPTAIEADIRSGVDYFNRALANSEISGRARIVHLQEAPEDLSRPRDDLFEALADLNSAVNPPPFAGSEVADLRRATAADVVTLYVGRQESSRRQCGIAFVMARGDDARSMAPYALSAVNSSCREIDVLAHEIGHNLGLNHNVEDTDTQPSEAYHPWSFGHRMSSSTGSGEGSFRTIMSYGRQPRIDFYSRADHEFEGSPIGIAGERENTITIRETFPIGTRFVGGGGGGGSGPAAPSGLVAEVLSPTEVHLTWNDNAEDESGYAIEGRIAGETSWRALLSLPSDSVEALLDGLEPATTYELRVRSTRDSIRSSPSNVVTATTPPADAAPQVLAAYPLSGSEIRLEWPPGTRPVTVEMRWPDSGYVAVASPGPAAGEFVVGDLTADTPYTFRLRVDVEGGVVYGPEASATTRGRSGSCPDDATSLCLLDGRFEVRVRWRSEDGGGSSGMATAVPIPGSSQSGLFYFFGSDNIELVVKLLDGRALNQAFWHFYGALSDVEYWITARDTADDDTRTYHNRPGEICGAADTQAFPEPTSASFEPLRSLSFEAGASGGAARESWGATGGGCVETESTLCLQDGRFAVEVEWTDPRGSSGVAGTLPALSTRETGFYWFFDPGNVELAVKLLDARAINQHFWFFWGGLSDVEYTIRIHDLAAGSEATYRNAAGEICGGADVEAI